MLRLVLLSLAATNALNLFPWQKFGQNLVDKKVQNLQKRIISINKSSSTFDLESIESEWLPRFDNSSGYDEDFILDESTSTKESIGEGDTYGEILPSSMRVIINNFMTLTSDDIMYDLGSGVGKIVAQFAYETECGKCIGIEIGELRHSEAVHVLKSLQQQGSDNSIKKTNHPSNKIELRKGDCTKLFWGDATVLFINALCFPADVWDQVEILIRDSCPNLRYLMIGGQQLKEETEAKLQMRKSVVSSPASWADDYICFLYTKPT